MNLKEIQELIRFVAKSGVSEVQLEQKDFKIVIKSESTAPQHAGMQAYTQQQQQMPQVVHVASAAQQAQNTADAASKASGANAAADESRYETIRSPMIGTFYRKPSPDKDVFVKIGDTVAKGEPVCVIEAMKLFNEIESDIAGRIVKVLVEDSSPVEYDQPLFLVEPA